MLALSVAWTACATQPQTAESVVQFADIPVPDGMVLVDHPSKSHAFQSGEFRYGDFAYDGRMPVTDVASYMQKRMSLHGWQLQASDESTEERVELRFIRRPQVTKCVIWRDDAGSHMTVAVRTTTDDAETTAPGR